VLFHLITNVWGAAHTDLFLRMTLPNVLSAGNLPALAAAHTVRYRIHTTPGDRERIVQSAAGRRLAQLVEVEFVTPLGTRTPDVAYHVHWFHKTAAEAKREGAVAVFVPPDTLWSDGSFRRCGEVMAAGRKAIATPFLQVTLESCLPEAEERYADPASGSIRIPPEGLAELGRRHLHPLTALALPGSPHGRPALELYWPAGAEGFVSRFAVRELFAFDPRRCPITFLWYAAGGEDRESIHFSAGPHDMGMLSVDPLHKYFDNYIADHAITPGDLVRSTLHPWNDTAQTRVFARRRVHWRTGAAEESARRWRRAELASDRAMRELEVRRLGQRLWARLREIGCSRAAGFLAVALEATSISRRWREDVPLTVLAPVDAAFENDPGRKAQDLLRSGAERELSNFLRRHVMRGALGEGTGMHQSLEGSPLRSSGDSHGRSVEGRRILDGPHRLDGIEIWTLDGLLFPAMDTSTGGTTSRDERRP